MKEIETNPRDMTSVELRKELEYWRKAEFAGPKTRARVEERVKNLEKELKSRASRKEKI